jgi:hypothetical protein
MLGRLAAAFLKLSSLLWQPVIGIAEAAVLPAISLRNWRRFIFFKFRLRIFSIASSMKSAAIFVTEQGYVAK